MFYIYTVIISVNLTSLMNLVNVRTLRSSKSSLRRFSEASSQRRCSVNKGALKNFTKFTGKHPCQSLFFNKIKKLNKVKLY